jgi:hypothetical protein
MRQQKDSRRKTRDRKFCGEIFPLRIVYRKTHVNNKVAMKRRKVFDKEMIGPGV